MSLRRVPPNLLVAQGATDFAFSQGMPILPHEILVSPGARERWLKWKMDIKQAERRAFPVGALTFSSGARRHEPDTFEEEKYHEQIRQEHLRALLDETWNDVQNGSSPHGMTTATQSFPSETLSHTLNHHTQSSNMIDENSMLRPYNDYIEASHSAFVNSTQQLPTVLTYGTSSDACPDCMSELIHEAHKKGMFTIENSSRQILI